MTIDQVIDILIYVLPIVATVIGAKVINQNSLPWHLWNGRIAKLLGLLVTVLDALRSPKKYASDVAPDKIKKKVDAVKKISTLSLIFLIGCAGWQFTGSTWQETGRIQISNVAKVSGIVALRGLPLVKQVCDKLTDPAPCHKVHDGIVDAFDEIDDYLLLAERAIQVGEAKKFDEIVEKASVLLGNVIEKLAEYGAL